MSQQFACTNCWGQAQVAAHSSCRFFCVYLSILARLWPALFGHNWLESFVLVFFFCNGNVSHFAMKICQKCLRKTMNFLHRIMVYDSNYYTTLWWLFDVESNSLWLNHIHWTLYELVVNFQILKTTSICQCVLRPKNIRKEFQ